MSYSSGHTGEALVLSSAGNEHLLFEKTHTHPHTLLTVKTPVESIEGGLQRPAGLSDQPLCFSAAETRQVLLHGGGTTSRTLRAHPQMFTWKHGEKTQSELIYLIVLLHNSITA